MLFVLIIQIAVMLTVSAQHNLTPSGTTSQSSYFNSRVFRPEYAIQTPISNSFSKYRCSHTYARRGSSTPAWWMFKFSFESAYITDIVIYYREGFAYRMDGFKLYITNTPAIPPDGYLCYEDSDPGLPNITQTFPCNHLGKYVIYYDTKGSYDTDKEGPIVELCYVAINGCQKTFWGSNCKTLCAENCLERHCYPGNGSCVLGCDSTNCFNDNCKRDSAICTDGCKTRWTGNHCNKYNLASNSLVSQDPIGSQPANLAIDGSKTSCSKTNGTKVTFQVDLKNISIVIGILITFVEHTSTEGDHTIYASNTSSSWKTGTVLYKEKYSPTEVNFFAVFRYLTYVPPATLSYVSLELCEIGVIGCPPTHYGPVCAKTCPQNCQGPCDIKSGNCIFGCLNGWSGDKCDKACTGGRYGKDCLEECSEDCLNPPCNPVTGECIDGCNDGWLGFNCTQKCHNGSYGTNCLEVCNGCISNMCDHVDGLCDNTTTCNPGYVYGKYCNKVCEDWFFGNNCTRKCNCLTEPCNWFTGKCAFGGCAKGWQGESCDEACFGGHFGRNCNRSCDGCISNSCEATDGLCYNTTGCEPGYFFEEYCNNTCDDWYFGTNCSRKCNCLTGPCNWFTGKCPTGGCKKGWQGQSCEEGCNEGHFGRNCDRSCDGCISNRCEATDGLCYNTTGCEPGYLYDEYCNNTCDDWYFGNDCTGKCYCLTGPCNWFTGKCPSGGCQTGWHGESCEEGISELQKEDPPYAAAIGGGAAAVILILLIIVVFIIYSRRRFISRKDRNLHRKSSRTATDFDTNKKTSGEHNYANVNSITNADDVTNSLTENGETESQIVKNDIVNVYGNVLSVSKYKIMNGDLKAAIHEKQKGEDFKKEYEILQKGLLYAHVEGSKEENKVKNRFLSLWPCM